MHRPHATLTFREHSAVKRAGRRLAWLMFLGSTWAAFPGAAPAGRATIDSNGDGVLDEQELRTAAKATFETADADNNGYLTADELGAARMAGDIERRTRGLGALLSQHSRDAETAAERFDRLDADGDGRIAEKEFVDAPHPLLRFDTDGDGRVTREEIEQARKPLRSGVL
jgi:Ca2+-binding EF-hand superfamily protein